VNLSFRLKDIIPMEDLDSMGRRRYQQPNVFKTGGRRPMWYFRARVDRLAGPKEKRRPEDRFYLGFTDEMTKQDAKKRRDEVLSEVINKPQLLIPSQVKFAEVLKVYRRDHLAGLRSTTREMQESALKRMQPLAEKRMCDIDTLEIQQWLSRLDLAYRTKAGYLSLLRVVWQKAEDWGFTQQRFPRCRFALGVNRQVKGHDMPTMDQLRRLITALDEPYRAMAEIALYSGLRISEIRGLKWEDLDGGRLIVQRRISEHGDIDVPKSSRNRVFDARPLAAVFARLPRVDEWVFNHDGCSYYNCLDKMQAARKAAGIKTARFGWHHLRACFNTLVRAKGADAVDRQALLGHTSERMNSVYVMQAEGDVQRRGDLMLEVQAAIMGETKGVQ
jgi:integrase